MVQKSGKLRPSVGVSVHSTENVTPAEQDTVLPVKEQSDRVPNYSKPAPIRKSWKTAQTLPSMTKKKPFKVFGRVVPRFNNTSIGQKSVTLSGLVILVTVIGLWYTGTLVNPVPGVNFDNFNSLEGYAEDQTRNNQFITSAITLSIGIVSTFIIGTVLGIAAFAKALKAAKVKDFYAPFGILLSLTGFGVWLVGSFLCVLKLLTI